jgi:guanylate kinase
MSTKGRLIVLSGPSGAGKDTVLRTVFRLDPRLRYSVSYTTRPPRPGEEDGVHYSFVDEATFRDMESRGELLEAANVHGHLYGTSRRRVEEALQRGEDIVLKIDVQGAAQLRGRVPDALFIFLLPPSLEALRQRLRDRGTDDDEALARRITDAERELAEAERYDHRVVNDDVVRAAREILDIVAASRGDNTGAGDG